MELWMTETVRARALKASKLRLKSCPVAQPTTTHRGSANSAICRELPMTTPIDRSILSFMATITAVICSQAFPAMGNTIIPRNMWPRPVEADTSSMLPVKNSELKATSTVIPVSRKVAAPTLSAGCSPPSSSSPLNSSACVFSWKRRYKAYMMSRMMAHARLMTSTESCEISGISWKAAVGVMMPIVDRNSSEEHARLPMALKLCVL
mmetsp:Transcript_10386/g.18069  ORF Transcript_10386/g.18069 Transcript_10386/m.18069 type:complete len:207 (-) Transcript_10386:611-1231(-)